MTGIKVRALHVIGSTGIVTFHYDESHCRKTAEVDLAALRSVTEAELLRYRNCGPKTAPVAMEYINNLREILL